MMDRLRFFGQAVSRGWSLVFAVLSFASLATGLALPAFVDGLHSDRAWLVALAIGLVAVALTEGGYQLNKQIFGIGTIAATHESRLRLRIGESISFINNRSRTRLFDDSSTAQSFRSHFPDQSRSIEEWDQAVARADAAFTTYEAVRESELRALEDTGDSYNVLAIRAFIDRRVPVTLHLAIASPLDRFETLGFGDEQLILRSLRTLEQITIINTPGERAWATPDEADARAAAVISLFDRMRTSRAVAEVNRTQDVLSTKQDAVREQLIAINDREIHPSRECGICRHNAGLPDLMR